MTTKINVMTEEELSIKQRAEHIRKHMPGYIFGDLTKYLSDAEVVEVADLNNRKAAIYNSIASEVRQSTTKKSKALKAKQRLEEIRTSIENENISYSELAELTSLVKYIESDDVQLLEAAGVAEQ